MSTPRYKARPIARNLRISPVCEPHRVNLACAEDLATVAADLDAGRDASIFGSLGLYRFELTALGVSFTGRASMLQRLAEIDDQIEGWGPNESQRRQIWTQVAEALGDPDAADIAADIAERIVTGAGN